MIAATNDDPDVRSLARVRNGDPMVHNQDAEESVVGAVLLHPATLAEVAPVVCGADFYHPGLRAIFDAVSDLDSEAIPIDVLTVADRMRALGTLDKLRAFGGEDYLVELQGKVVTVENIAYHAKIVRSMARRRRLAAIGREMSAAAVTDDDADELIGRFARVIAEETVAPTVETPGSIVERWREEGPLVRVPTGIAPIDELSRGGWPFPWRVLLVGAPAAGKTFVEMVIADAMARSLAQAGIVVGILGVDEDPEDLTVRLAQIAGYTVEEIEKRSPAVLKGLARELAALPIRLYDAGYTIESAAADLAQAAAKNKTEAALFIDSIQTARSAAALMSEAAASERAIVQANVSAVRAMAAKHRLLVVVTSEANRNAYRSQDAAEESNDMAAGAESRAIEYGAQTMLMLRTPKDHPDVIWARIVKNRRANVGQFFLRIDRERHTLTPCPNPAPPSADKDEQRERKRVAKAADVERDARALLDILRSRPGTGERDLRAAWKAQGLGGRERLDAARDLLQHRQGFAGMRLVDRGTGAAGSPRIWELEQLAGDRDE